MTVWILANARDGKSTSRAFLWDIRRFGEAFPPKIRNENYSRMLFAYQIGCQIRPGLC